MLSDRQIDYFHTFGFLVLRQHLDPDTVDRLSREIDRALHDAFGPDVLADRSNPGGGIPGHYLPTMGAATPVSRSLVEDERLVGVAQALLGADVLPTYAESILYYAQTPLHCDDGLGLTSVKFVAYLEPLDAGSGALRLLGGSHHPGFARALRGWQDRYHPDSDAALRRQFEELPCTIAETRPGDLIAFDQHVWHGSSNGRDRRQWTVTYLKDTPEEAAALSRWVADERRWLASGGTGEPYAVERYPMLDPDWLVSAPPGSRRERWRRRWREIGLLDVVLSA
jgi:hypothetical protein